MLKKKLVALVAAGILASCLALAGCGSQPASSSAASEEAPSTTAAASESAATSSTAATVSESSEAPSASAATASAPASSASDYIGEEAAAVIALKDAGFIADEVTELEAELDLDDAVVHYDVDFKQGGMEYDYDIDATSGEIITSKSEVND